MPTQSRQLATIMFTDINVMLNMNIGHTDFVLMVALALHPFAVKIHRPCIITIDTIDTKSVYCYDEFSSRFH